jgi:hypothetical protein
MILNDALLNSAISYRTSVSTALRFIESRRLGPLAVIVLRGAWISHLLGMLACKRMAGADIAKKCKGKVF